MASLVGQVGLRSGEHATGVGKAILAFSGKELLRSVAAPILGLDGGVRAALGIVAHSRAAVDRLAPAVRTAALGIARSTS